MQAPQLFAKRGFVVLYRALPEARINELRNIAHFDNDLNWSAGILDIEVEEEDRLQAPTLADSKAQPARREFESASSEADLMDVCAIPGSVMIATQDNTFLYAFGWNHKVALKSNRVLIELNKGDMLLFRGDLVYKPVGYSLKTICLHGVLGPAEYKRAPEHHPHVVKLVDDTIVQQDPFCFVWRCQFRGSNLASVRKHINRFHHIRFRSHRRPIRANPRSVA